MSIKIKLLYLELNRLPTLPDEILNIEYLNYQRQQEIIELCKLK